VSARREDQPVDLSAEVERALAEMRANPRGPPAERPAYCLVDPGRFWGMRERWVKRYGRLERPCRSCGQPFTPERHTQVNCPACTGRRRRPGKRERQRPESQDG
jgi:hypothetical protein